MKRSDITDEQVCEAYRDKRSLDLFAEEVLMQRTGAPIKVAFAAMERAASRGLVDYGVSLRSGWLTDKGREKCRDTKTVAVVSCDVSVGSDGRL